MRVKVKSSYISSTGYFFTHSEVDNESTYKCFNNNDDGDMHVVASSLSMAIEVKLL